MTVFPTEAIKLPGEVLPLAEKVLNQLTYSSISEWCFYPMN